MNRKVWASLQAWGDTKMLKCFKKNINLLFISVKYLVQWKTSIFYLKLQKIKLNTEHSLHFKVGASQFWWKKKRERILNDIFNWKNNTHTKLSVARKVHKKKIKILVLHEKCTTRKLCKFCVKQKNKSFFLSANKKCKKFVWKKHKKRTNKKNARKSNRRMKHCLSRKTDERYDFPGICLSLRSR